MVLFEYTLCEPRHRRLFEFTSMEKCAEWVGEVAKITVRLVAIKKIPLKDGRPGKYLLWMSTVEEFKDKWGVEMIPLDIDEGYGDVSSVLRG